MAQRDPDAFTQKYWPPLLIIFCAMILWYSMGDNLFAGAAGFGFWLPHRFDNERYLNVVRGWEEDRESLTERQASNVNWLTAIEIFLAHEADQEQQ